MITFACVCTGLKYSDKYIIRLFNMIKRNFHQQFEFVCFTDRVRSVPGVDRWVNIADRNLVGWWAKMLLFNPRLRGPNLTVYLDLDSIIIGDLEPLTQLDCDFAICENFTQLAGHKTWPCGYGSCCMVFSPGWGMDLFEEFWVNSSKLISEAGNFGDQLVIEQLMPYAPLLQSMLPEGFFLNKRELPMYPHTPPQSASVLVFGGNLRPDNCNVQWVKDAWI